MSDGVWLSRKVLIALGGLLMLSLTAVAFLLGRQTRPLSEEGFPSPSPVAVAPATQVPLGEARPRDLESRLDALEKRVQARQQEVGQLRLPTPEPSPWVAAGTPASPTDVEARRTYFRAVDALVGRSAFDSSQPFSARLLEQALLGGEEELERVLAATTRTRVDMRAIAPPPECREHHALVVAQLGDALELLKQVSVADSQRLQALTGRVDESQAEAGRLHQLDRKLREGL
jgi:hypothetical protein